VTPGREDSGWEGRKDTPEVKKRKRAARALENVVGEEAQTVTERCRLRQEGFLP
jgi:hypothetical protein